MSFLPLMIVGSIAVAWYVAWRYFTSSQDPLEPPLLYPNIPLIGHGIGLARQRAGYYLALRKRCSDPMFTLYIPGCKIYVVNSLDYIKAIDVRPHELSSHVFATLFAVTACGCNKASGEALLSGIGTGNDLDGLYHLIRSALGPGPGLLAMNAIVQRNIATSVRLLSGPHKPKKVRLYSWLAHEMTVAVTESVYGPLNPFANPETEGAFWDFENGLPLLMTSLPPKLIARKAYKARELMAEAIMKYLKANGHEQGSSHVLGQVAKSATQKIPLEDIARFEIGNALGLIVNVSPMSFWTLFYLFSRPEDLARVRAELRQIMTTRFSPERKHVARLNVSLIKAHCPFLLAFVQEVLRLRTVGPAVRRVMCDTQVGQYRLRAGAAVLVPAIVFHTDPTIWGPDSASFQPDRFNRDVRGPPPAAFRWFGGGQSLCPGRHLATTGILAMAAMMAMRYDLVPVEGVWREPSIGKAGLIGTAPRPDWDVEVEVHEREQYRDCEWEFELREEQVLAGVSKVEL